MCKKCKLFDNRTEDAIYYDKKCYIYWNGCIVCIYNSCNRPSEIDFQWMKTQLYIIATKLFDKKWTMTIDLVGHATLTAIPHRDAKAYHRVSDLRRSSKETE